MRERMSGAKRLIKSERPRPITAPNDRPGIYLIGSPAFNWFKIGKTTHVHTRFKEIDIGVPFVADVVSFVPVPLEKLSAVELAVFAVFADQRVKGEWFVDIPISKFEESVHVAIGYVQPAEGRFPLRQTRIDRDKEIVEFTLQHPEMRYRDIAWHFKVGRDTLNRIHRAAGISRSWRARAAITTQ